MRQEYLKIVNDLIKKEQGFCLLLNRMDVDWDIMTLLHLIEEKDKERFNKIKNEIIKQFVSLVI